jgi:hypothetical protein
MSGRRRGGAGRHAHGPNAKALLMLLAPNSQVAGGTCGVVERIAAMMASNLTFMLLSIALNLASIPVRT